MQNIYASETSMPLFEWIEPWVVSPPGGACFHYGDNTTVKWAFGASSKNNGDITNIGAKGEKGSATATLKADAHVPGGTHIVDPFWTAQCGLKVDRTFRLSDSPFGWKIYLKGTGRASIATGADNNTFAAAGAWAGLIEGTECPTPTLLGLEFGHEAGRISCDRPGETKVLDSIKNGSEIDIQVTDSAEGLFFDGIYTVVGRNRAIASADTVGFGNTGHGFARANFFDHTDNSGFKITISAVPLADPELLINVNAYFPILRSHDVESKSLDTNKVCEPGYDKGTFTIRTRFHNTSTDTTLSGLVFKIRELSNGNILCNADNEAGVSGATLVASPTDEYTDGLLSPGESFVQTFKIGLDNLDPFRFYLDLSGVIAKDETAPSLIQSTFGPDKNNFEVVAREPNGQLRHYFREFDTDKDENVWDSDNIPFALGSTSAPSLVQSTFRSEGKALEVVVRGPDRKLHHYVRLFDDAFGRFAWSEDSEPFAPQSTSAPALIQSTFDGITKLELVVRDINNQLQHYFYKQGDDGVFFWKSGGSPFAHDVTSSPALIQSTFGARNDNFHAVVRQADNKLHHYIRRRVEGEVDVFEWIPSEEAIPAENVTSAPALIKSYVASGGDNFEIVVRQADNKLHHYFRRRVVGKEDEFEWRPGGVEIPIGNVMSAPSLIQSTEADNLELVVREGSRISHYFRRNADLTWNIGDDDIAH